MQEDSQKGGQIVACGRDQRWLNLEDKFDDDDDDGAAAAPSLTLSCDAFHAFFFPLHSSLYHVGVYWLNALSYSQFQQRSGQPSDNFTSATNSLFLKRQHLLAVWLHVLHYSRLSPLCWGHNAQPQTINFNYLYILLEVSSCITEPAQSVSLNHPKVCQPLPQMSIMLSVKPNNSYRVEEK